jgi:peptide/nickel transport system substrate-binding protein|tara:strand:- start:13575 stop:14924 length:1350 start_codon:yes stop_codon:yes gene_type:complete
LAEPWEIAEDGTKYTFSLKDAKWHDGKPFTSADVKYTLENVSGKFAPVFASAANRIVSIDTPDDKTAVIALSEPFGPFLMSLACPQGGAIMPEHLFAGTDPMTNPASNEAPVGTGPFKFAEWKRGDYIRLEANKDYWQEGKPYLDEVFAKAIPQAASRLQALKAGEVDFIPGYYVSASDYGLVRNTPGLKMENSGFAPGAKMLFLNNTSTPLDRKEVRQALMYATDRDFLYKAVWFETGGVGKAPFTTKLGWAANPDVDYREMYPYDVDKANAMLDAVGLPRGADGTRFDLTFVYTPSFGDVTQVAPAIKNMWKKIGVDVTLEAVEGSTFGDRIYSQKKYDLTIVGYTSYGDPALGIGRVFISTAIGRPYGNASQYSNPEIDALFEKGAAATSLEERATFYREIQARMADELPMLTLQEYQHEDAASESLHGVWGGQGYGRWGEAWLQQ